MSLIEKIQGRQHVIDMLKSSEPSTWPEIMDRLEAGVKGSGDGDSQKRFSAGFIKGVLLSVRDIRNRMGKLAEKAGV